MMNKNTFGDGKASESLVDILSGDNKLIHRISSIFNKYCRGLHSISQLEDNEIKKTLWLIWVKEYHNKIEKKDWDKAIKTHFQTVCWTQYKKYIRADILPRINSWDSSSALKAPDNLG